LLEHMFQWFAKQGCAGSWGELVGTFIQVANCLLVIRDTKLPGILMKVLVA